GPLSRAQDIERQRPCLRPLADRGARCSGEQRMTADGICQTLLLDQIERLAQCEQQVLGRRAAVLLVVDLAFAKRPVPIVGAQAQYGVRRPARRRTARAGPLAAANPRPGGAISPFCEPAMATSRPQPSMSNSMQPSEATVSTISRAGWRAALTALAIAATSLTTPEAVSICTSSSALIACPASRLSRSSTAAGLTARRQSPRRISTSAPITLAISPQPVAKRPLSSTSTLSPRDSTLLSTASQPPWPLAA